MTWDLDELTVPVSGWLADPHVLSTAEVGSMLLSRSRIALDAAYFVVSRRRTSVSARSSSAQRRAITDARGLPRRGSGTAADDRP